MRRIWGRKDGSNVMKVMWCIGELGLGGELRALESPSVDPLYRRVELLHQNAESQVLHSV